MKKTSIILFTLFLFVNMGCDFDKKEITEVEQETNNSWSFITNSDDLNESGEYVLIFNGEEIGKFELTRFTQFDLKEKDNGGVLIKYWNGGPEGGEQSTLLYNENGKINLKTKENRPFDSSTFIFKDNLKYKVSSIIENTCDIETFGKEEYDDSAILTGIKLSIGEIDEFNQFTSKTEQNFDADFKYNTRCAPTDGSLMNPTIAVKDIDKNKVYLEFEGGKVHLEFDGNEFPSVEFK